MEHKTITGNKNSVGIEEIKRILINKKILSEKDLHEERKKIKEERKKNKINFLKKFKHKNIK